MQVGYLKRLLENYPDEWEVYLASDEEWNRVTPLYSLDESGFVQGEPVSYEDIEDYYDEDEVTPGIVLWG